jgi:AcrR family transcriptional regulator
MGKHRGQVLESALRSLGLKMTHVALRMKISRRTLYNYFQDDKLSDYKMEQFDSTFNLNLSSYYTKPRNYNLNNPPIEANESDSNDSWKAKYLDLLERYARLLEENKKY